MGKDTQKNAGRETRILCVWELGGNLGHLANLRLFAERALKRGHQVVLVVRELHQVPAVFAGLDVEVWQAPHLKLPSLNAKKPMVSYTDMAVQQCFGSESQLQLLVQTWQRLFQVIRPDLVIYDHAPSALVASVGKPWKKWAVGSGFLIPRTDGEYMGVFPDVRRSPDNGETLRLREQQALSMINAVLKRQNLQPWQTLNPLFCQCDRQLLMTVPEVDHFGERKNGEYLGIAISVDGVEPHWPEIELGRPNQEKVFVYVNNFLELPQLLNELLSRSRVLVYCKNLPNAIRDQFSDRIAFCDEPVNMDLLLKSRCRFVTNGNHGTATQALLAGIPQLMIPLQREQYLLSVRINRSERGIIVLPDDKNFCPAIDQFFELKNVNEKEGVRMTNDDVSNRINSCFQESGF